MSERATRENAEIYICVGGGGVADSADAVITTAVQRVSLYSKY